MWRNQYDTDVTVWSPDGQLHQVAYAMKSVEQGSCSLAIKGGKYVVGAALRRSSHKMASSQKKIFKIDDHMGIAISGLTGDARVLATYMRTECLNHKYFYNSPIVTGRLASDLADKHQAKTQASWNRPYGVGMLIMGVDRGVPHLYKTCPSGRLEELKAMAIGGRSQTSKTYLEKHIDSFETASRDQLILHALKALQGADRDEQGLTADNTSVSVVGVNDKGEFEPFTILEGKALERYLNGLK